MALVKTFWYNYYDSIWQAIATVFIHAICSFIILVLLFHTMYHFRSWNNLNKPRKLRTNSFSFTKQNNSISMFKSSSIDLASSPKNDNNQSPTPNSNKSPLPLNNKKSNNKNKSKNDSSSSQQIAKPIKILTIIYILLTFSYSSISFLMRFFMVFFNLKINCLFRENCIIIALLGRIVLFIIFSIRLQFSFRDTIFAYNPKLLWIFTIFGIITTNSMLIYFFMMVQSNRSLMDYKCHKPGLSITAAILPYAITDIIFNTILVILFCRRLTSSVKMIIKNNTMSGSNRAILKTAKLITKLSIISSVTFISTLVILMVLGNYILSACISIDNTINVISILVCFSFNGKYYNFFCCICKSVCFKGCKYILQINIDKMKRKQRERIPAKDSISDEREQNENKQQQHIIPINDKQDTEIPNNSKFKRQSNLGSVFGAK